VSVWAYLFEPLSVRDYILEGGHFSEQIAAAELIDAVDREPLAAALAIAAEGVEARVSRQGAGAFEVVLEGAGAEAAAFGLRDLWGLAVGGFCPDLAFVHAVGEGEIPEAALRKARGTLERLRRQPAAVFPEAPPIARRAPRTIRPAVAFELRPDGGRDWLDAATLRKRRMGAAAENTRLGRRFLDEARQDACVWPDGLEIQGTGRHPFPFLPGNRYLAIIHAGIEGAHRLPDGLAETAARAASAAVLVPAAQPTPEGAALLPARPLLLGTAELSLLARADRAVPFAAAFLEALERALEAAGSLPPVRAAAGIAFIRAGYPLARADHEAAALCRTAAAEAARGKPPQACLAFARVQAGPDPAPGAPSSPEGFPAYRAGRRDGVLPHWERIDALAALFSEEDMAQGPTRQLSALLGQNATEAGRQYRLWREVLGNILPGCLVRFDYLMDSFGVTHDELPLIEYAGRTVCPLIDALVLRMVGHGAGPAPGRGEFAHG
jgi:hypothetical protein